MYTFWTVELFPHGGQKFPTVGGGFIASDWVHPYNKKSVYNYSIRISFELTSPQNYVMNDSCINLNKQSLISKVFNISSFDFRSDERAQLGESWPVLWFLHPAPAVQRFIRFYWGFIEFLLSFYWSFHWVFIGFLSMYDDIGKTLIDKTKDLLLLL